MSTPLMITLNGYPARDDAFNTGPYYKLHAYAQKEIDELYNALGLAEIGTETYARRREAVYNRTHGEHAARALAAEVKAALDEEARST